MTLDDVKAGDEVALHTRHNDILECPVERVTGKQIILSGNRRYWIKGGREVGTSGDGAWRCSHIYAISNAN